MNNNIATNCPPIPVCCYIRCSDIHHIDDSIETQLGEINKYAGCNNMSIIATYIDLPRRGKNKHIERDRMLDDAEKNPKWQKILFFSFDRFARKLCFFQTTYKQLRDIGIELISVTQPFNSFNKDFHAHNVAMALDEVLNRIN